MGEVAVIGTGSRNTQDALDNAPYPFFVRSQQPLAIDSYDFDESAVITAGDGVGVGKVFHYISGKYALHQRAYRIVPTDLLDARYLYFYFTAFFRKYLDKAAHHSSVTSLRKPMFERFPIPLPPIEEQKHIADILDKMDALVNDLTSGLPAELEARRKQYAYYRDRLLTFKEKPQM